MSLKVIKILYLQKMEFTLGEESEKPSKKELTAEELSKHLDRLLEEKANNQRIYDWVEVSVCFGCVSGLFNQTVRYCSDLHYGYYIMRVGRVLTGISFL